ncbi:TMEM175 family protein [Duganella sp. CT11-25]|uniref:TMEM175 family protein n=1 Tax=unclassified Duganella TaxID=2636909 RepID=UPI0039AF289C
MGKGRLEAFSDGVIAIIITIMVLELKVPHGADFAALQELLPVFLSYVLSFVYVGIFWNNHHHMLHASSVVDGRVLWANLHLLFWLSLVPFATGWMGENHFAPLPVALYGGMLFMSAVAYTLLEKALIARNPRDAVLAQAVGKELKGIASAALYLLAIPAAFLHIGISFAFYVLVAGLWFLPDRRIEASMFRS